MAVSDERAKLWDFRGSEWLGEEARVGKRN